jgi:threonine/homoserine/homoserine lactone efflux protein
MTPVAVAAGVALLAWFGWQCRRAVKSAARPSPHGGLERRRRGSGDGSSLPVPAPGELRTTEEA